MQEAIREYLERHRISYRLHRHPAVFTVEEARIHCAHLPGKHCKNLFLKEKEEKNKAEGRGKPKDQGSRFYLIILPAEKRLDIKLLQNLLGLKKLS